MDNVVEVTIFEETWKQELEKAKKELESILADGSEEKLVQRLIEQDELDKEEAKKAATLAIEFAIESFAKLQVLKNSVIEESEPVNVEDN